MMKLLNEKKDKSESKDQKNPTKESHSSKQVSSKNTKTILKKSQKSKRRKRLRKKVEKTDISIKKEKKSKTKITKFEEALEDKRKLKAKIHPASEKYDLILQSMRYSSNTISIILEIIHIVLLNRLIFSKIFSEKFQKNLPEIRKNNQYLASPNSILNSITYYFDPLRITYSFSNSLSTAYFFLINVLLALILIYIFRKKSLMKTKKIILKSAKEMTFVRTWKSELISILISNYEVFFFFFNILIINSFYCHTIEKTKIISKSEIGNVSEAIDFQIQEMMDEVTGKISNENILLKFSQNSVLLNPDLTCHSFYHYVFMTLSTFLIIPNCYLMYLSHRITSFIPDIKIRQTKTTLFDLFMNIATNIFLIAKIILEKNNSDLNKFTNYLSILSLSTFFAYFMMKTFKPYYNENYKQYKNFKIIYIFFISGIQARIFLNLIKIKENLTLLATFLTLTFLLKLNNNLSRDSIIELDKKFTSLEKIKARYILLIYYKITKYFSIKIKEAEGEKISSKELEQIKFLIIHLREIHKKKCKSVYCFCRRHPIFMRINSLTTSYRIINKENLLLEMIMVMELLFKAYFEHSSDADERVFRCHMDFLINYFGKPALAYRLILLKKDHDIKKNHGKKLSKFENLEMGVLLVQLDRLVFENLRFGNLALKNYSRYFSNDDNLIFEDEGRIGIVDHIIFLENFDSMKNEIKEAVKIKTNFLAELLSLNSKLQSLTEMALEYYEKKESATVIFENLKKISRNFYSPIYCVYGHFMYDICEDRTEALKVLKRYERIMRNYNLNKIFSAEKRHNEECVIMKVQADTKIQRFTYVSSNIKHWLGWKVEEAIGEPLDIIVPRPVAAIHRTYFEFDRTREGGRMFMEKLRRNLVCVNKEGFLVKGDLTMRFNINISNSLQMAASFNFSLNNEQVCILVTEKSGNITEMTKSASQFFEIDQKIQKYNSGFEKIYNDFNDICDKQLQEVKFQPKDYKHLIKELGWLRKWSTYCKWKNFQKFNIIDKNGEIKQLTGRLEDFLLYDKSAYIRFVIIQEASRVSYSDFDPKGKSVIESESSKIMKEVVKVMDEVMDVKGFEDMDDEFVTRRIAEKQGKEAVGASLYNEIFKEKYSSRSIVASRAKVFKSHKDSLLRRNPTSHEKKISKFAGKKNLEENKSDDMSMIEDEEIPVSDKNESMFVDKSHGTSFSLRKKKQRRELKKIVERRDSGSSTMIQLIRFNLIERLIHRKLNPRKIHRNSKITISTISFILLLNSIMLSIGTPLFTKISKEYSEKLKICDLISWEISSLDKSIFMTDICRATREGWFDNNISKELRDGEKLFENSHKHKLLAGALQLLPENAVDSLIRSFEFKDLFNYETWVFKEIKIPIYVDFEKEPLEFEDIEIARRAAIKYIHGKAERIFQRDYENSSEILNFGRPGERLVDREEELYRRLLLGGFNRFYVYLSYEVHQYFKNLMKYYHDTTLLYFFICFGLTVLMFLLYALYMMIQISRIKEFYLRLFDIKEKDITAFSEIHEKLAEKMKRILIEEKVYDTVDNDEEMKKLTMNNNTENMMKKFKKKKLKSNFRFNRLKLNLKNSNKDLKEGILSIMLIFVFITVIRYLSGYLNRLNIVVTEGTLELYLLEIETWNGIFSLHTFFLELVLWNDTLPTWGEESTLGTYKYFRDHVENKILRNLTEALDYRLGNYSDEFNFYMTKIRNIFLIIFKKNSKGKN